MSYSGCFTRGINRFIIYKKYPEKVRTLTFSGIFPVKRDNWEESLEYEAKCHEQLMENEEVVTYMNQIHEKVIGKHCLNRGKLKIGTLSMKLVM